MTTTNNTTEQRAAARAAAAKEREAREAAAQLQREQQKKERDAARKKEEEEAKKKRDEAEAAMDTEEQEATKADEQGKEGDDDDMPDANINEHLSDMNAGGGEKEGSGGGIPQFNMGSGEADREERSPAKKKKKKDKKKKKKDSVEKEKGEKEKGADSILKPGRYSKDGSGQKNQSGEEKTSAQEAAEIARAKAKVAAERKEQRKKHVHKYRRNVVECSIVCVNEEEQQRYNELPAAVRKLFSNLQKVDSMVCLEPVVVGEAEKIFEHGEIPYDHTELGSWVKQGGGMNAFALKSAKKWGNDKEGDDDDEQEMVMPEVYFTVSFSSDKEPDGLLERVAGEWGKLGGKKLYLKEIASFSTMTAVNIFHLRNDNTQSTVLDEFRLTMEEAMVIAEDEDEDGWLRFSLHEFPVMSIRKLMPKIPGQDTSVFKKWKGRQQENRKVLAIEADEGDVEMIHYLVELAKNRQLFEKRWGRMVKVTVAIDNRKKRGGQQNQLQIDMAAVASYSRKHINYSANTRMDGIRGIFHVDKQVPFYSVSDPTKRMGHITLRRVLYKYLKMSDGHNLLMEVHQAAPMGPVDVVVPNAEEAERMMLMMQKNAAAYLYFFLNSNTQLGDVLVAALIRATMDPILVNSIEQCKWDAETRVLTTPEDEENDKAKALEDAAWYNDEFGDHMVDTSRKEKAAFASKEALAELNCDHSFKSIHQKKGNYVGSPDAESFQLGSSKKPMEVDSDGDDDEEYLNLSQKELIAMLKQSKLDAKKTVGSQPNSERSGSGSSVEGSESGSDSSSSGSSVSGESVENAKNQATSPSSEEGNSAPRKPGQSG